MPMRQVLGMRQRSLAYLLQRYCGIRADKSLGQTADWRQRWVPGGRRQRDPCHPCCWLAAASRNLYLPSHPPDCNGSHCCVQAPAA